jgi:uncharacterized protein (DUF433 family)
MFDRITFFPNHGWPRVHAWTRIPLSVIVGQIAHAASFDEILEGYPDLERDDTSTGGSSTRAG